MTMANYDDIFNASSQKGTEDKSFVSFNKEEWAAQKLSLIHISEPTRRS